MIFSRIDHILKKYKFLIIVWDSYENYSKNIGVNNKVTFYGHQSYGHGLMQLYKDSDIFVFPSLGEGFPRVLYEAMSNSLPIVSTNVGGISQEVPNNIRGILVKSHSAQKLSEGIIKIINNSDLREKLINNGYEYMLNLKGQLNIQNNFINKIIDV